MKVPPPPRASNLDPLAISSPSEWLGEPALAIDASHVYARFGRAPFRIRRMPKTGGPIQEINLRDRRLDPSGGDDGPDPRGGANIAIDGDRVYFLADQRIMWLPKAGGVPLPLVLADEHAIAAGAGRVCAGGMTPTC